MLTRDGMEMNLRDLVSNKRIKIGKSTETENAGN